jgi:hypothetical protein
MPIDKSKRQKMENMVYEVFNRLDPSGINTTKYKDFFSSMNDSQFDSFFKDFFSDDSQQFILDTVDYERDLKIEDIENAADFLGVPLFEKVAMPFVNKDPEKPVVTKYEVPVGYVHIKRVQQILSKKNSTSTDIGMRSAMTGQVIGKDKNARDSDQENFALVTLDANDILREFLGPRADDIVMKNEMYAKITRDGFVSLNDLTDDVTNKTTLNTLDVHLIGMGLKSSIITKGLLLKKSLK